MKAYGGYRGVVVAALALLVLCVLLRSQCSHGVDGTEVEPGLAKPDGLQPKRDRSKPDRAQPKLPPSTIQQNANKVQQYSDASPAWVREHPGKECPDTIDELNKYIGVSDSLDWWGRPIKLLCGPTTPPSEYPFTVVSAGEDGKFDTDDDVVPF
jgi:hypothetical protein